MSEPFHTDGGVTSLWKSPFSMPETMREIATRVANRHGLTLKQMTSRCRERTFAWPARKPPGKWLSATGGAFRRSP